MANFQSIVDDLSKSINQEITNLQSVQIICNFEFAVPFTESNLPKELFQVLRNKKFGGYSVKTCRIREIADHLYVDNKFVDKDIEVKVNIVLERT